MRAAHWVIMLFSKANIPSYEKTFAKVYMFKIKTK